VIAAGLAAAMAESVSMAAVAYTSTQAERALFESERAREHRHIAVAPELEREEIRELYRRKGFEGALLDEIVRTITSNPQVWVAVMMVEELELKAVEPRAALRAAIIVGVAALVGSLVPLAPFAVLPVRLGMPVSIALGAAVLFAAGAYQALTTVGHWLRTGLELAAIGMAAALIGYGVGRLFQ
jgi:VIT1/CCC1 family predicted Fe2+/Mn2+ transporter